MTRVPQSAESETYRRSRDELLAAEAALRDHREQVAELRRQLPPGPEMGEYVFHTVPHGADVSLFDLFDGRDTLLVYHFMYGTDWDEGCPSCSMWLDGLNGVAPHIRRNMAFAVVAKAPPRKLAAWAGRKGWGRLRLVSSESNTFNRDLQVEKPDADQDAGISVFLRQPDGSIRLFYSTRALMDGAGWRFLDLFTPVWHLLDLTPSGRGDWDPSNGYESS